MTPLPRTTAQEQLERLLYILPAAARTNGARIRDIASALDVSPQVVLRDLREAMARSYDLPAGSVENFTLFTDGRRVYVHAPHDFNRPVRLSRRETLALTLGLRMLAADTAGEERTRVLELAARLEQDLVAPDVSTVHELREERSVAPFAPSVAEPELEYDTGLMLELEDDGFRGVVADAIEEQCTCTIAYLKPGDDAPQQRRIAPYRLIYASGKWYVAAHDFARNDLRMFRLDRVLDAVLEETPAPAPPDGLEQILASGAPYMAVDDIEVSVRYSPRVARWIVERTGHTALEPDGSAVVRHRVADARWIVRHVLQYGGEAVVEGPQPARDWIVSAAARFESHG
jgi:predicted DNA-binding transcriptional regulator YafY